MSTERKRLERFFRESVSSYERQQLQEDEDAALKAVAEAIAWACALDEYFKQSDRAYEACRDDDRNGELMRGVRYARNRALHQFAAVVEITDGAALPMVFEAPLWEFSWRPAARLPPPTPGRDNAVQRAIYEDKLAGVPVRFTLDALQVWFASVP